MRASGHRTFSAAERLALLAAAAVLLPTMVLVTFQYRQSRELQTKTQTAAKEDLRETLLSISKTTEDDMIRLSDEAFGPLSSATLSPVDDPRLKEHFSAFARSHPEITALFVVPTCSSAGKLPAHLFSRGGWRDVPQTDQEAKDIVALFNQAQAAADPAPDHHKLTFWQQSCKCEKHPPLYVFRAVPDGFLGLEVDFDHVQQRLDTLLAQTVERNAGRSNGALVISALGEDSKEMFATGKPPAQYDVAVPFAPVFPRWQLAGGYSGVTIAELARRNFETNLLLDGATLALLLAGIVFTLRAATREVRLAQAKSSFVSNVSHELKTPLALIRLFAEILELGRATSREKEHEYHRIIHRESRRLTQLINNILDFSKIEAGRRQYQFTSCNLVPVLEEVLSTYEYQITNLGFELKTCIASAIPPARVDADAIAQAVLNLLNNALKYSGNSRSIEVNVEARDGQIAIAVIDHGIGIPRAEQEKIFEKFYRVSNDLVHTVRGTGLGLALVKHIVDAHNGKILVDSAPGKGSRFTILLPCHAVAASSAEQSASKGYFIAESSNS